MLYSFKGYKSGKKSCLVIRHGALGDAIMASCVLPYLKKDGYEITFMTNERGKLVLDHNPYITHWIYHEDGSVPIDQLDEYWDSFGREYDKVVNLTGVVENKMLFAYPQPEYFLPVRKRRKIVAKKNYYEEHLARAGYAPNGDRLTAEIYLSQEEKQKGKGWRKKHKNSFRIVWALVGSSNHKVYRYYETVAREFLKAHPDALLFTTGDYATKLLTFEHPQVVNTMMLGKEGITFREAMILAKYSNLVIGPETGLVGAASAFNVPIICLLSHSGPDQLTKTWPTCRAMQAPTWCSPCHILWKYKTIWQHHCHVDDRWGMPTPKCTEHGAGDVLNQMEEVYRDWKSSV